MIEEADIKLNRNEAEKLFAHLGKAMETCVGVMATIERKKSWRASEKAMAKVPYEERRRAFEKLREKIGTAFNLGGY